MPTKKSKAKKNTLTPIDITLVGCKDNMAFVGRVDTDACNSCYLTGEYGKKGDPVYVFETDVNGEFHLSKSAIVALYKAVTK